MNARNRDRQHLSHSSIRQLQGCAMAWRLQRIDRVAPSHISGSLVIGSVFHCVAASCLFAVQYGKEVTRDLIDGIFEADWKLATRPDGPPIRWPARSNESRERALCAAMIKTWVAEGLPRFTECEILAVERQFCVPVVNTRGAILETPLQGSIDVIVRDPQGRVTIIDHKTAASPYREVQIRMNLQPAIHTLAAKHMGYGDVSFAYHVVTKHRKRPVFKVVSANRTPDDLNRLYWIASEAQNLIAGNSFLPVPAGIQCEACQFQDACNAVHRRR